MIRVIIADDQPFIREGIKFILGKDNDIKVVGCASDGKEALELCEVLKPDVILMDIIMPICDGIEGTRLIKQKYSHIKILILTTFHDEDKISNALKNGADGYVLKDIAPDELKHIIKNVVSGLKIIHPTVYDTIIRQFKNIEEKKPSNSKAFELTVREKHIAKLIVYGKSNREIGKELSLSEGRIKNIITCMLEKLNLKDRTQLAVFAVQNKIFD